MRKDENACVSCPTDLGCLTSCPYRCVTKYYCDSCGNDNAVFNIAEWDYCSECAEVFLQDAFDELTILEKAHILDIEIEQIEHERMMVD